MKFLQLILVTTPVALASPLSGTGIPRDTSGTQQVNIDLQVNKVTSESTIETGRTSKSPIAFDVDQDGFGTLTFDDKTYTISGNPEVSGGIDCGSIVSDTETLISCIVPGQAAKLPSCFPDGGPLEVAEVARAAQEGRRVIPLAETMRTWQQLDLEEAGAAGIGGNETVADTDDKEALSERQYNPCSQWTPTTIREGDGDPHQTAKHIQVTVSQWISAGFRVEKSTTTGEINICHAEHDWVAAWMKVGRTSYRVRNGLFNACTGTKPHGPVFTITSPNSNSRGGNPYCVRGKRYVRNVGDSWDEAPKPGLP
ncbi:hypothetical protein B0T09DRAFT_396933 [Sordaria sp. MPI-SDFR-AT-0083]|nr:hypothetical protein B0T09DRAFT_396933 [Sordaria sp. MPI-SDFR-AT-0083]